MKPYLLAIDQGTSSTRVLLFDAKANIIAQHQIPLSSSYPAEAWVEQDPQAIWKDTLTCCRSVVYQARISMQQVIGIGISNQRETTIVWDKSTGQPVYPAIGWQDRRTAQYCQALSLPEIQRSISKKTGLLIDPYFSASKIHWILENVPGARKSADNNQLAFGTVDSFLLWQLTGGKVHATDATNASRTMLFNIHEQTWDQSLLDLFHIPASMLPKVQDSASEFGRTSLDLFQHEIPITGIAGDQQAASIGQAVFQPGMIKSTYGTGCFILMNTGDDVIASKHRLISTVAYRINNKVTYGLEGSIFSAGSAIQWLLDTMHPTGDVSETQSMAMSVEDTDGIYMVPAFTGLGAPYWDSSARAAILGLTPNSKIEHIFRAALEAVCYQTKDLIEVMKQEVAFPVDILRVDGGMVINEWLLQFLSDMLGVAVDRPACIETSALGAALLAGLGAGIFQSLDEISALRLSEKVFYPQMERKRQSALYSGWLSAVRCVLR